MLVFDFEQMYEDVKNFKSVVIYGADDAARIVKNELIKRKMPVIGFFSHNPAEPAQNIDGIPVFIVNAVPNNIISMMVSGLCVTVIAIGEAAAEQNLNGLGAKYIKFIDYHIAGEYIAKVQGNWDKTRWIEHIDKWYAHEHGYEAVIDEPKHLGNKEKIIFLVLYPNARLVKIIRALQYYNFEVECIFFYGRILYANAYEIIKDEVSNVYILDSFIDAIHFAAHSDAKLLYIYSHLHQPYLFAFRYLIQRKSYLSYPIVFDEYDLGAYFTNFDRTRFIVEKDCVELADVYADRCYLTQHLVDIGVYNPRGKVVQLLDCCDEAIPIPNVILKENRPLSLVFTGSFAPDEGNTDTVCWHKLIKDCEDNQCYLHIYPSPAEYEIYKNTIYAEYIRISQDSEYFRWHDPVSFEEAIKREAECDYGLFTFLKATDDMKTWCNLFHEANMEYRYHRYFSGNRYYDFINAGIPIIANYSEKLVEIFDKFGIVVKYAMNELDFEYLKAHRNEYRARVPAAREKLLMKDHIVKVLDIVMPEWKNFVERKENVL